MEFLALKKRDFGRIDVNLGETLLVYDTQNIFAKIIRGEIPCEKVYEGKHVLAFHDIAPQAPVHILVIPKGQYISLNDFSEKASDEEASELIRVVGKLSRDFNIVESGYRILANHGKNAHQEVPHFHVHLLGGRDLGGIISYGG